MLKNVIKRNRYEDSVVLMALASRVKGLPGVTEVSCLMATPENLGLARTGGLLTPEGEDAGPNDLLVCVDAESDSAVASALAEIETALSQARSSPGLIPEHRPRSTRAALDENAQANLALISVPGRYVKREALLAVDVGLHVFIFSDNVPLEDEVELKQRAARAGVLAMGPDCGTALINGKAIGFANVVRRGNIGIVAAAGTGLQEVSSLIHRAGGGVSQGIGTGGRDLNAEVGGLTMLAAMEALEQDRSTEAVVLISKPPSPAVAERILQRARTGRKRYVVNFLGRDGEPDDERVRHVSSLVEAAGVALELARAPVWCRPPAPDSEELAHEARTLAARIRGDRRYVRGLFAGGTLCFEALLRLERELGPVNSNTPLEAENALADVEASSGHTVVDLGADEFTRGRPHPMIDPTNRVRRGLQEVADPETALILLDVVLGYGAAEDPAEDLVPVVLKAVAAGIVVVASVCGTDDDPQNWSRQKAKLLDAGAVVMPSNAAAACLAAAVIKSLDQESS